MKSRCLWTCLLWLCLHMAGVELFAQTNNRVTGSVRDSLGTGLENCTVLLYAANDSLPVAGTSIDIDGYYEYYRSTMGRTFRVLLGANYTFNKGRTSQEKQQKVKSYGRSMEADVKTY